MIMADTGTDFAWAWNAPLMQLGGPRGVLITSGRAFFGTFAPLILSLIFARIDLGLAKILAFMSLGWAGSLYALLTLLTWPQRAPRESITAAAASDAASA